MINNLASIVPADQNLRYREKNCRKHILSWRFNYTPLKDRTGNMAIVMHVALMC